MKNKKYLITEASANQILNYLATRPYNEVHVLITSLQNMGKYEEKVIEERSENDESGPIPGDTGVA